MYSSWNKRGYVFKPWLSAETERRTTRGGSVRDSDNRLQNRKENESSSKDLIEG